MVNDQPSTLVTNFDFDKWCQLQRLVTLGRLAPYMAHEANQPLASICNYAGGLTMGLLKSQPPIEQVTDTINKIMSEAFRASAMLKRLRDAGSHKPFESAPIEINTLVRNTLDLIKDYLLAERTAVQIMLGSQIPIMPGDVSRIEQVLINLIMNSVEAMGSIPFEDRGIVITTRFSEPHIEISVQDTGPMLTASQTAGMLEPCHSHKPFGLGIGLWISNQIIQKQGGELELRPADPHGLKVTIRLPGTDKQLAGK